MCKIKSYIAYLMIVAPFITAAFLIAIEKFDLFYGITMVIGFGITSRFYLVCHKCKHPYIYSKNKLWVNPFYIPRYCNKCGQDLLNCEIESDEIVENRKDF